MPFFPPTTPQRHRDHTRIEKLKNRSNGSFQPLTQPHRIQLEVLAQLILDIQNQDLEVDITEALTYYRKHRDPSLITWIL